MNRPFTEAAHAAAEILDRVLPAEAKTALALVKKDIATKGKKHIDVVFPGLVRRFGRSPVRGGVLDHHGVLVDFDAMRFCDVVAAVILAEVGDAEFAAVAERLFTNGDFEERRMILKAMALLPIEDITRQLLETAHRTNDQVIFEAAFADSSLAAAALGREALSRSLLKAAIIDLDPTRLLDIPHIADPELSRMLLDLMSEREAAGRSVWRGTLELAAHAPTDGVEARILGDLWHGQDGRRLAAAHAAKVLRTPRVLEEVRRRLGREMHPPVKAALEAVGV